ncbi:hypothetical protein [Deinococcus aestuarii]|uniref:hypothetical protein n=1 Tax=Deinococcus aestuarii TaxID=2774531 RepID=UPI001C0C9D7B|nr:hypothetical protein [Deinococcus aestuarii]
MPLTVTGEVTVRFDPLGPVSTTCWMARHVEEAGRLVILPLPEEGGAAGGTVLFSSRTPSGGLSSPRAFRAIRA